MSFTPLLATTDEVALFTKNHTHNSFQVSANDFVTIRTNIHQATEARILREINQEDLTAVTLAADPGLQAVLKQATIMVIENIFDWWKQKKAGTMISFNDLAVTFVDPLIFTSTIKDLLAPYKVILFVSVDPDEDYS